MLSPVPFDRRVLQALRRSPLVLDLYAMLNYRCFTAKESQFISWQRLMQQLGCGYGSSKDFGTKVKRFLQKRKTVPPYLIVRQEKGGIRFHPSRPGIAPAPKTRTSLTEELSVDMMPTIDNTESSLSGNGTFTADFLNTAGISNLEVFDANMNPLPAADVISASGTDYSAAPEPSSLSMWSMALVVFAWLVRRRSIFQKGLVQSLRAR